MRSSASALERVRSKAIGCERCPLYANATQTVFGEGPVPCDVMLVGEQPGDREDIEGRPFVGPAGRMLDKALEAAGLERRAVYVTNAVKHFKKEPRGKRRLHKRPTAGEIDICKWWLDAELDLVRPKIIIALGASAARAPMPLDDNRVLLVTIHPALLLRMPDRAARENAFRRFVADLSLVSGEPRRPATRAQRRNFHPSARV